MKQHLNQGDTLLPVVLPLIFYRGTGPYRGPLSLLECFRDRGLAQEMFALIKPIQLISLSALPDDILLTHKRCAVLELVQKYIHSWDLAHLAPKMFELFERYPLDIEKRKFLLYYLAKEGQGLDREFVPFMLNIAPHYQEDIMSAAQYLIEEGRQKGLQEGEQKGESQMALTIAKNMLEAGAALNFIKQMTWLSDEKIATLELK